MTELMLLLNETTYVKDIPIALGDATVAMLVGTGLAALFLLAVLFGGNKKDKK